MNSESKKIPITELAALVGGRVVKGGDAQVLIERVAGLESAEAGAISFVAEGKFLEAARASRASCLLVPEGLERTATGEASGKFAATLIEVAHPKLAFALVAEALHSSQMQRAGEVHPTAIVAESALIGEEVYIGARVVIGERAHIGRGTQILAGAVLGDDVEVGEDCVLHPHVVLYRGARLGNRVTLHAGVVVGADGFGYVRAEDGYHKFPQVGAVVIEDDVEIGANSCVDRGALGETRIGRGTKLDNLVQVAHNVQIGERVVIAAQTGISGSTVIEHDAVIGGQVGMGDHARVRAGAIVGSKAGILPGKIVRAGAVVWGVPVRPLDEYKRLNAHFGRLPQMRAEIDELKRQVRELAARLAEKPEAEQHDARTSDAE